jgi:hypothetical protein
MISQFDYLLNKLLNFEARLRALEGVNQLYLGENAYRVDPGPRQWTTNDSWTNINSTNFQINGDDFRLTTVYWEALACVEVAGRTVSLRIYNVTDAEALTDSVISTGAVSSEGEGWINAALIRSSALTFPSGLHNYRLQFMQSVAGGGGDSAQFFKGALIYKQE